MAMANLTLSLDDALLQKAREAALRENTSVNALVRDYLSRYVDARSRRLQALDAFEAVADRCTGSSQSPWSREALHERDLV
jgi:predicted transcriptional regulator